MDQSEKIEFLAGEVHALMGFATAIVMTHPDISELAEQIEQTAQANLALAEGSVVPDEFVEGVQHIWDRIRKAIKTSQAQQTIPKG
jgi:hypothetical protein